MWVPTYTKNFRLTNWIDGEKCITKIFRNNICIYGVEDINRLIKLPHLFANKIMPETDFAALTCLYEKLFNMTYIEQDHNKKLDEKFYKNLATVRGFISPL